MRIHQMSDLHLEFNNKFRARNTANADVLMLNGDILVADYLTKSSDSPKYHLKQTFLDFFKVASEEFSYVVYNLGNHEHYYGTYKETASIIKEALTIFSNIFVLDNESVKLGKYKILGTTLWTDCDKGNPLVLQYLGGYLNDFRIVKYSKEPFKKFLPIDSMIEHKNALKFLDRESENEQNIIVMSHHAPSEQSIHSSYQDAMYYDGNRGYFSNLEEFILERPQIKLWTHGHMHTNHSYKIGTTRVVCNPMGYGVENVHGFKRENIIELV